MADVTKMSESSLHRKSYADCGGQIGQRVIICDDLTDGSSSGESFYFCGEDTYDGADIGTEVTVLSYVVPAGQVLNLTSIYGSFLDSGQMSLKVNGVDTLIKFFTSPAHPNAQLNFEPSTPIAAGDTLTLCFCSGCEGDYFGCIRGSLATV